MEWRPRAQHRNGPSGLACVIERNMYGDDPEKNRIGRGNFYSQYDRRTIHQRTAYHTTAAIIAIAKYVIV